MQVFEIKAHLDAEANVCWAASEDVPGLVAKAPTSDAMLFELRQLDPDLLAENEVLPAGSKFQIRVVLEETEDLCVT